jgi:hypothetical protein
MSNIKDRLDENDPKEGKLKRITDQYSEEFTKSKDSHKDTLITLKSIYERF